MTPEPSTGLSGTVFFLYHSSYKLHLCSIFLSSFLPCSSSFEPSNTPGFVLHEHYVSSVTSNLFLKVLRHEEGSLVAGVSQTPLPSFPEGRISCYTEFMDTFPRTHRHLSIIISDWHIQISHFWYSWGDNRVTWFTRSKSISAPFRPFAKRIEWP